MDILIVVALGIIAVAFFALVTFVKNATDTRDTQEDFQRREASEYYRKDD